MPVKRKRQHRVDRFAWELLDLNDIFCLNLGHLHHRPEATAFRTVEDLREAYTINRDRLLAIRGIEDPKSAVLFNDPGTRPKCFWKFEATERPKFIGWRTVRFKHWMVCGNPLAVARGVKVGDRIDRRKVFEDQETVLRRLGEISPEEEALLDGIKQTEAQHVRGAKPDCRCRICATNRTYPRRLERFLK